MYNIDKPIRIYNISLMPFLVITLSLCIHKTVQSDHSTVQSDHLAYYVVTLYSIVNTLYTNVNTLGGRNTLRFCPKGVKPILLYYLPQNLLFHSSTWLYFGWSSRLFLSQEGFSSVFQPWRPFPISFQL